MSQRSQLILPWKTTKKTTQPRTFLTDFSRSSFTNRSGSRSVLRRHFSRDGEVLSWMMVSPGFCVVVCWIFCVEKWFVWVGPVAYNDPSLLIFTLCSMGYDIFQHLPQSHFLGGTSQNISPSWPCITSLPHYQGLKLRVFETVEHMFFLAYNLVQLCLWWWPLGKVNISSESSMVFGFWRSEVRNHLSVQNPG